jgi:dTDP-4-dehydrorhamnose reductase
MHKVDVLTELGSKVLLLGSTGLLGSTMKPLLGSLGYDVVAHGRNKGAQYQADLTHLEKVTELFDEIRPEVVINLVGLTDVELCEASPNQAYLANVRVVENITDWIKQTRAHCHLVQISTDQVYDGIGPHDEGTATLTNYYAFSKYAGELAAMSVSSTILRTNFFGISRCAKRVSLTDWLYRSLVNVEAIQVFDDVQFNPLSMTTLSHLIGLILKKKPKGVFNLGSQAGMSKAEFAYEFAQALNFSTSSMAISSADEVTFLKTYRPKDMRMDCSKIEGMLGIKLPLLRDEIKQVAEEYYEKA